mmetsp:Transcript_18879/g.32247  ORF Transcript_18879/g.32247 Transcript_18879/m.32247 type:complete len:96 (+) Transcript_18879:2-289(+)
MHFYSSNERYEGQWMRGQMTGFGQYYFSTPDKKSYAGQFFNGDMYGNGVMKTNDYVYRGMIKSGVFDGFGRFEDLQSGVVYEGNFKEGYRHGFGK